MSKLADLVYNELVPLKKGDRVRDVVSGQIGTIFKIGNLVGFLAHVDWDVKNQWPYITIKRLERINESRNC